ncbi:MAG TPA: hypothetical protein DCR55_05125 [Lentisphaeria bacterium]|nr:hypothetical protein [Lentisphaeria bacterium]
MPLNIAVGDGKTAPADHRRYFEIARGGTLECAASQGVSVVGKALGLDESRKHKAELDRIVAMLSRPGGRRYLVEEEVVRSCVASRQRDRA